MTITAAPTELMRALGVICESQAPGEALVEALGLDSLTASAHTELFLWQLLPHASVYLSPDGMLGGEVAARIGDLWQLLGGSPPADPDHLAALMGLYASLLDLSEAEPLPKAAAAIKKASSVVLWNYILTWVPPYLAKASQIAQGGYRDWATLFLEVLASEAEESVPLPTFSEGAKTLDDFEPGEEALKLLFAPGVSGILITRADLAACGGDTGLGLRLGERWYTYRALLEQSPHETLQWTNSYVKSWIETLYTLPEVLKATSSPWIQRAQITSRWLERAIDRS